MVDIHQIVTVPKDELFVHPQNSNKQSRHMFNELRKSIRECGFDETLLVVPRPEEEGFGYHIISGNHRFKAGVAEGMKAFPCVIREDWDEVKEQVELVRRNYVRGKIDKDKFTVAVDVLAEGHALSVDDIRAEMGFGDSEEFMDLYRREREQEEKIERVRSDNAPKVKMIDDLGMVLSGIFEQYGDTVDQSFIIFPAGGRRHLYVAATPALKRVLEQVASKCIAEHMDINMILGGLLALGMDRANFMTPDADLDTVTEAGSEEGESDL